VQSRAGTDFFKLEAIGVPLAWRRKRVRVACGPSRRRNKLSPCSLTPARAIE
jgi:hypothetical protein